MKIYLADICYPDYFLGSPDLVLAVPVFKKMRYGQLLSSLIEEIEQTEEIEDFDGAVKAAKKCFKGEDLRKTVPGLQDIEPDGDTIYAYFIITQ